MKIKPFSIIALVCLGVVFASSVSADVTVTIGRSEKTDRESIREGTIAFDSSYPTNGETLAASSFNLTGINFIDIQTTSGYHFEYDYTNSKVKVYKSTGAGTSSAGSSHNHTFTGTSAGSLNLATPAWSGTGLTAAGQVMTTTDNLTMTLNEAAGMWLIPATGATPPMLILSNTAVTGAPGVLTVQGAAATDAGAYKIVKNIIPVGTNAAESSHTHTITADVGDEVSNATNLSTLTGVKFRVFGY